MLDFLNSGKQKQIVGISLTPGIGLEVALLDRATMSVSNYGVKKVEYNFSNREIQNYIQFKTALSELFDEMGIPAKSLVYIVLPNVYFDFIELPPATSDADLKNIFLSKAEEFYLFKKEEPVSGWFEVANIGDASQKRWAFSAMQKSVIDQLKDIIRDLGMQLVGVETDYSATLRGMQVAGLIDDVVFESASWSAMLINTNSYVLFQMDGKQLVTCSEVPLAVRSYSTEEAYDSIAANASQLLKGNETSTKLYIISQTDEISADLLKNYIDFVGEIVPINTNKHAVGPIIDVTRSTEKSEINKLTLSTLGACYLNKKTAPLILNAMADDPDANLGVYTTFDFMGQEIEVTNELIAKLSITFSVLLGAIFAVIVISLALLGAGQEKQITSLSSKIKEIDAQTAQFSEADKKPEIDITGIIDEIAKQSITSISYYDSIATDIPKNIWLTKYYNKNGDQLAIKGIAQSIVDIYDYYKNLRAISPQTNIKLTEMKVITDSSPDSEEGRYIESLILDKNIDRLYSFEIANIQVDFTTQQVQRRGEERLQDGQTMIDKIKADEAIIIRKQGTGVEQTSDQMTPAE